MATITTTPDFGWLFTGRKDTLRATVTYHLSEAGQRKDLLAGGTGKRIQEKRIDVPTQHVDLFDVKEDGVLTYEITDPAFRQDAPLDGPGLLALVMAVRADGAAKAEEAKAKGAERLAEKTASVERGAREYLADASAVQPPAWVRWSLDLLSTDLREKVEAEMKTRRALDDARAEAANRARAIEREAKKKAEAEGRERLIGWAKAHGSDLLKARLEEGMSYVGLAHEEYAYMVLRDIDGRPLIDYIDIMDFSGKDNSRDFATLEEIRALRIARETIKKFEAPAVAALRWKMEDDAEEEDGDTAYATLDFTIICPDGEKVTYYRLV